MRRQSNKHEGLPLTIIDTTTTKSQRQSVVATSIIGRQRKNNKSISSWLKIAFLLLIFMSFTVIIAKIRKQNKYSSTKTNPFSQLKSLDYPFENSELVALYFASSWCPECRKTSAQIEKYFSSKDNNEIKTDEKYVDYDQSILLPQSDGKQDNKQSSLSSLAIVYVSSDRSQQELENNLRYNWIGLPYNSHDVIELKRHFQTFANIESKEYKYKDVKRKHGIPTLVIIDSETKSVLTRSGVNDVMEYGSIALDHWLELKNLVKGMEDKYESIS